MKKIISPIIAVGIAMWVVSCSKQPESPSGTSTNSTATAAPGQMLVTGAGSTFDYPAFTKWFEAYKAVNPNVQFNYQSIGSGAGQKQLLNQTVEFGASDAPMSDESMTNAPGKILHLPVVAGGVAIIYNLPGDPKL